MPPSRPVAQHSNIVATYEPSTFPTKKSISRSVTLNHASSSGGAYISKSQDGVHCAVAGRDSLRILRMSHDSQPTEYHKSAVNVDGYRIDATKNFWVNSLKVDSASTDVVWGHGHYDHKLLTSAKNGELVLWDLNKSGHAKYERRVKDHSRAIHKLSYSLVLLNYCISGSADGCLLVWDLRDLTRSIMRIRHTDPVRTVQISPCHASSLHAVVGLDNGNIYRWDLKGGGRTPLDRLPVAHTSPILSLDWCTVGSGGWLASGGLDRTVKVWDLSACVDNEGRSARMPSKPTYTLHTSYRIRRVAWKPESQTEIAVAADAASSSAISASISSIGVYSDNSPSPIASIVHASPQSATNSSPRSINSNQEGSHRTNSLPPVNSLRAATDELEIWDVRRSWVSKWTVEGSSAEGGICDMVFGDSSAIWATHPTGGFSQLDLQHRSRPIDSISRVALSWNANGAMSFVGDDLSSREIPYDDGSTNPISPQNDARPPKKQLGDPSYLPVTQYMGIYTPDPSVTNIQTFVNLAKKYRIHGAARHLLCEINSDVAFNAEDVEAGHTWLLVKSLLIDFLPKPSIPPSSSSNFISQPTAVSLATSVLAAPRNASPQSNTPRSASSDALKTPKPPSKGLAEPTREQSPSNNSSGKRSRLSSLISHRAASPLTPTSVRPRSRRHVSSNSISSIRSQRLSLASHSRSPSIVSQTHTSLRHVGEGALDDSDSSTSPELTSPSQPLDLLRQDRMNLDHTASLSPTLLPIQESSLATLGQDESAGWPQVDEGEESTFPDSSESDLESDDSGASRRAARSSSLKRRSRKRSSTINSTLASLSAASHTVNSLQKQDSQNSADTILGNSSQQPENAPSEPNISTGINNRSLPEQPNSRSSSVQSTQREAQPILGGIPRIAISEPVNRLLQDALETDEQYFLEHSHKWRAENEKLYRDAAWASVRDSFEYFVEMGNVQLCAILALIIPQELKLSFHRRITVVETYIDLLFRMRLHAQAAYIRKYSHIPEISGQTQVQTTLYSVCASCRRPITSKSNKHRGQANQKGRFCPGCSNGSMKCAICHLPVRGLLFTCAVCSHGGHRECYRSFYEERPLSSVTVPSLGSRGRSSIRQVSGAASPDLDRVPSASNAADNYAETKIKFHPCAAGCGHHCWYPDK